MRRPQSLTCEMKGQLKCTSRNHFLSFSRCAKRCPRRVHASIDRHGDYRRAKAPSLSDAEEKRCSDSSAARHRARANPDAERSPRKEAEQSEEHTSELQSLF